MRKKKYDETRQRNSQGRRRACVITTRGRKVCGLLIAEEKETLDGDSFRNEPEFPTTTPQESDSAISESLTETESSSQLVQVGKDDKSPPKQEE